MQLDSEQCSIVQKAIIDTASAARFIRPMSPEWKWLLQHIEAADGYVQFSPLFSRLISRLSIENYPDIYENEAAIGMMMLRAFFSRDEINALEVEVAGVAPENRCKFVEDKLWTSPATGVSDPAANLHHA